MNPADVAQSALPLASADVSLISLFWHAHFVVKTIMLGLLACSVWVWAIAIDKMLLYSRTKKAMDRFEQAFWSGQSIDELYRALAAKPTQSMAALFVAAMREWKRSFESHSRSFAGLQMRIDKVMSVSIAREVERLDRRLLVLATVGSASPFVGLFGTVWGIMSSFQSIAASKNTSLAVVAPGIAEALFATAIGLIAGSVWVWAIAIDKLFMYARTRRAMDRFEQAFWSGQSIEDLYRTLSAKPTHSMAALFVAAMREWKRSFEGQSRSFAGLQMRIEKVMNVSIAREVERLERRLLVLATVGSAGPFVGLFGTVWGIMSSFQSIAASKNTSLAVVAPGIAEALFATAIGLIAAIPATIFYNKFSSEVNRQAQRLEGFADEFSAILSRQIDERGQ